MDQVASQKQQTALRKRPTPQGLTAAEVQERIRQGQVNDFEARVGRTYGEIFRDNVLNLFNIVLGTLLVIVIASGDYTTAFFAGFSVVSNSFLGMIQEINAKRKLDRLATLSQQKVTVFRDGQPHVIPKTQVVKDDVILIEPGDRLVVDGKVLWSDSLEVDESLLTGESDSIYKEEGAPLYSGSFAIAGTGYMVATRVGKESNINKLSVIAKQYKRVLTPTQKKINAMVEISVMIMFILGPLIFVRGYLDTLDFLPIVRNAVVFVTSLVPQGLVLVAILSLTIGAIKISRHQTLVQRVNAVESLANCTVLCFDKTGTLTRNELAVDEIITLNDETAGQIEQKLRDYINNLAHLNHTAQAVADYVNRDTQTVSAEKIKEIPFSSARKWGAIIFEGEVLVMGAPERILSSSLHPAIFEQAQQLQQAGKRVLAFARMDEAPPSDQILGQAQPIALVVMSDQIREDIQDTLQAFRDEHIDLKVISGDNIETVKAIASLSGMNITGAYTGEQLDAMSDAELQAVVQEANVFARVEPDTKRRIVAALQQQGEYVAMTGDGVNDVPALKQADLAVVMNDGAQISKDIGDIVLLNNAMSTLPRAFHEGREITQTIYGTTKMFIVRNVYNILLFIFVFFMALPFPITPIQISWAAFGTVNMPATFIAFGWVRPKYMARFRRDVIDYVVTAGVLMAWMLALHYIFVYFYSGGDVAIVRSATTIYICLLGMNIVWAVQGVDIYEPHTFRKHWRIVLLSSVMCALTILAMYGWPSLFEFKAPPVGVGVFTTVMFLLTMVLVSHGMKYRYLLYRLWMLLAPSRGEINPDEQARTPFI